MRVLLDPEAVARRDAFTMLFWGSLVSAFGNRGPMALVGAAGLVVAAVALRRLRSASTDGTYRSRVGWAVAFAYAAVPAGLLHGFVGRYLDPGPGLVTGAASVLLELAHSFAVIGAMSRLAGVWDAAELRQHWVRAFRLMVATGLVMTGFTVGGFLIVTRATPLSQASLFARFFLLFVVAGLLGLAGFVQYLVALWRMRSAADRAARVPVPGQDAAVVS